MLRPPVPRILAGPKCAPVSQIAFLAEAFLAGVFLLAALFLPVPAPALDMTLYNTVRTQEINWMGLRTTTGGSVSWTTAAKPHGRARCPHL